MSKKDVPADEARSLLATDDTMTHLSDSTVRKAKHYINPLSFQGAEHFQKVAQSRSKSLNYLLKIRHQSMSENVCLEVFNLIYFIFLSVSMQ